MKNPGEQQVIIRGFRTTIALLVKLKVVHPRYVVGQLVSKGLFWNFVTLNSFSGLRVQTTWTISDRIGFIYWNTVLDCFRSTNIGNQYAQATQTPIVLLNQIRITLLFY